MKRITLALVVVAASAMLVSSASANSPSGSYQRSALGFASACWTNPYPGLGLTETCRATSLQFEPIWPYSIMGYVRGHGCTIHLNSRRRWNWWNLCETVTHEYGHTLGLDHSRRRDSIMYPTYPNPVWGYRFPACESSYWA